MEALILQLIRVNPWQRQVLETTELQTFHWLFHFLPLLLQSSPRDLQRATAFALQHPAQLGPKVFYAACTCISSEQKCYHLNHLVFHQPGGLYQKRKRKVLTPCNEFHIMEFQNKKDDYGMKAIRRAKELFKSFQNHCTKIATYSENPQCNSNITEELLFQTYYLILVGLGYFIESRTAQNFYK